MASGGILRRLAVTSRCIIIAPGRDHAALGSAPVCADPRLAQVYFAFLFFFWLRPGQARSALPPPPPPPLRKHRESQENAASCCLDKAVLPHDVQCQKNDCQA